MRRVARSSRIAVVALVAMTAAGCYVTAPVTMRPMRTPPTAQVPPTNGPISHSPAPVATPPPVQPRGPGNPPFYEVMGERYYVMGESEGYQEQGIASWYGREFHGRRTSNGEIYDMHGISAAHKTLPLPTRARVTNLNTGKSIVVRINDRGPFKKGRIIDLSYGAARELGMLSAGTVPVEVQALPDENPPGPSDPAAPAEPQAMFVQVGAFGERRNAEALQQRLAAMGISNTVIRYDARGPSRLHRVRIGPVADAAAFDAVVRQLLPLNLGQPQLIVERTPQPAAGTPMPTADAGCC